MLIIRKEQFEALSKYMEESFVSRLVAHLKEFWPEKCQEVGEEAICKSIHNGIDFARKFGITMEYDVARYIDLMYEFGWSVDEKAPDPWAQQILTNMELDGSTKMDRLYEQAELLLEQ